MPHTADTEIRRLVRAQRNRPGDRVETLDDAERDTPVLGWSR
jgi:hypothetical protein